MQLRDALADYKHNRDHATRFPGERRTTAGRFTGTGDRLVHVAPDGSLRDFGYPLSGLTGVERSRFGLRVGAAADAPTETDERVVWFDDCASEQRYVDGTTLIETRHETPFGTVRQYDLAVDRGHLTRFELSDALTGAADAGADGPAVEVVAYARFTPDGRDDRVGQLRTDDAVELYHADEHDFLASASGFAETCGQQPRTFEEILGHDSTELPRCRGEEAEGEDRLSGSVVVAVEPADDAVTLASLLTDRTVTSRDEARARLDDLLSRFDEREAFERAASDGLPDVPGQTPHREAAVDDVRVLALLSAPTGLRIAGPEFDPYYRHSGGYGYTWFRDDAEVSAYLLTADEQFDLGLDAWHRRSAAMYCQTQCEDGSWPHRVWAWNGSIAPGWANGRLEDGDDADYQADQTASVVSFLVAVRDRLESSADAELVERVDDALATALDGLDDTLAADGRPVVCQNAWEEQSGRFAHTAATFLEAYASLASADSLDADLRTRAAAGALRVYEAIDDLWSPELAAYAMCETPEGGLDERYDSASLALVSAHRAYDDASRSAPAGSELAGIDDDRLDRLVTHVDGVIDGLYHDSEASAVEGLVRYEGDAWRQNGQGGEKVWTVSTAWGANAAAELAALLADRDDPRSEEWAARASDLLALIDPNGQLAAPTGYLPEQFFDDGTPDSATPLGWPHAIRLATHATLDERGVSCADGEVVADD